MEGAEEVGLDESEDRGITDNRDGWMEKLPSKSYQLKNKFCYSKRGLNY